MALRSEEAVYESTIVAVGATFIVGVALRILRWRLSVAGGLCVALLLAEATGAPSMG